MGDEILVRPKFSGIYLIKHSLSGQAYIGSSKSIWRRWTVHRNGLTRGAHHCSRLQDLWGVCGEEGFELFVLEKAEIEDLVEAEQHWMDKFIHDFGGILNTTPVAFHVGILNEAQRAAISRGHYSRKFLTNEIVLKIRERLDAGEMPGKISSEYGLNIRTVCNLNSNKSRSEIGREFVPFDRGGRHFKAKLQASDVPQIRQDLSEGKSLNEIGRRFGVGPGTIRGIAVGKLWNCIPGALEARCGKTNLKRSFTSTFRNCPLDRNQIEDLLEKRKNKIPLRQLSLECGVSQSRLGDIFSIYLSAVERGQDPFEVRSNSMAKLTPGQVVEIRTRFDNGERSQKSLAKEYGIKMQTLCGIVNGKLWKHLPLCQNPGRVIGPRKPKLAAIDQPIEIG